MKTLQLTPTQVALAQKLGISVTDYAKQVAQNPNWPMPAEEEDDEDFDNDPNKQEIMNAPIKALHDMWEIRFGACWVEVDSLDEEWDKIYGRLMEYDLLEEFDGGMWVKPKEQL